MKKVVCQKSGLMGDVFDFFCNSLNYFCFLQWVRGDAIPMMAMVLFTFNKCTILDLVDTLDIHLLSYLEHFERKMRKIESTTLYLL